MREVRPKTEKKNGEQQRLEEEEVWKRRMKKGEREKEREKVAVARDNSIIESDPPTQPLPYFTPPPLWLDSISPSVYLPQVMSAVDPVRVNSAYWNHC